MSTNSTNATHATTSLKSLESQLRDYRKGKVDPVTRIYWDIHHDLNLKIAKESTHDGDFVLDVGCGTGRALIDLANSNRICTGIDPLYEVSLKGACKSAEKNGVDIGLVRAFSEHLPYKNEKFDLVLLLSTLQHVADQEETLREIKRVLKQDGALLISVPMSKNLFSLFSGPKKPDHFTKIFNLKELTDMLNDSGFSITKTVGCGFFPPLSRKALAAFHAIFKAQLTGKVLGFLDVFAKEIPSTASSVVLLCKVTK